MSHLASIYAIWGDNAEALAADINVNGGLVRQWRNRGSIPPRYWQSIIDAAARKRKRIVWQQFVPQKDAA